MEKQLGTHRENKEKHTGIKSRKHNGKTKEHVSDNFQKQFHLKTRGRGG